MLKLPTKLNPLQCNRSQNNFITKSSLSELNTILEKCSRWGAESHFSWLSEPEHCKSDSDPNTTEEVIMNNRYDKHSKNTKDSSGACSIFLGSLYLEEVLAHLCS